MVENFWFCTFVLSCFFVCFFQSQFLTFHFLLLITLQAVIPSMQKWRNMKMSLFCFFLRLFCLHGPFSSSLFSSVNLFSWSWKMLKIIEQEWKLPEFLSRRSLFPGSCGFGTSSRILDSGVCCTFRNSFSQKNVEGMKKWFQNSAPSCVLAIGPLPDLK